MANTCAEQQRQLFARSERVKGIDFHPTEPWVSLFDAVNLNIVLTAPRS